MNGKIILTIDDIPQAVSVDMADYLAEKNIPAVMFAVGENIEKNMDILVHILKKGIPVGNHSYSHPGFSGITPEEGIEEIEKTEALLNEAYRLAGVERKVKAFRFPYLDKGGDNAAKYQKYLRENGFCRIDDSSVTAPGYIRAGWNRDMDVCCSFDFQEYNIPPGQMDFEDVKTRMFSGDPGMGSCLYNDDEVNIVLLHSHDDTEKIVPGYYRILLDRLLSDGITFVRADWIKFS